MNREKYNGIVYTRTYLVTGNVLPTTNYKRYTDTFFFSFYVGFFQTLFLIYLSAISAQYHSGTDMREHRASCAINDTENEIKNLRIISN